MGVYAASDWHGQLDLANQVLDSLQPNDILYYLGDACDRGPDGIKIIEKLLNDDRVVYLIGNHEEFLIDLVPDFLEGHYENAACWFGRNGGNDTWAELQQYDDRYIKYLCNKIKNLPTHIEFTNENGKHIFLSHSGYEPWEDNLFMFKRKTDKYIWDRKHISHGWWTPEYYNFETHKMDIREDTMDMANSYIIHGHTPVQLLRDNSIKSAAEIFIYCEGHKIDIDLGSFFSNKAALLDLNTFEVRYFTSCKKN